MKTVNHELLSLARESRGLTQLQLVEKVSNLNQGNYSKMEKGLLPVPDETLKNIAYALDYPSVFFFKKSVKTPISSFYYRKRVSLAKKCLAVLESRLDILRMLIDDLLDSIEIPSFSLPQYKVNEKNPPNIIATKIREVLGIPRGPIESLVQVIEAAGVIVYFIDTDADKFDGITLVTDSGQPIIFINDKLPNDRKRFTIAHELGHLVMHIPFSPLPSEQNEEDEANQFASEFLMPYLDCRYELQNLRFNDLGTLKAYWKLSKAAIIYRAKQIKAIPENRYLNLNIELSRTGQRKCETGIVELDNPQLVKKIIDAYTNSLNYSHEDIMAFLALNPNDFYTYFLNSSIQVKPKGKIVRIGL